MKLPKDVSSEHGARGVPRPRKHSEVDELVWFVTAVSSPISIALVCAHGQWVILAFWSLVGFLRGSRALCRCSSRLARAQGNRYLHQPMFMDYYHLTVLAILPLRRTGTAVVSVVNAHPEICGCYLVPEQPPRVPTQYPMKWRQVMNKNHTFRTEVGHAEAVGATISWGLKSQGCSRAAEKRTEVAYVLRYRWSVLM